MRRLPWGVAGAALALAGLQGCGGSWDVAALERRHPELAAHDAQLLGAATPYVLPLDDVLEGFLCRWPTPARLGVSLPSDASAHERSLLEKALRAWEQTDIGVVFEEGREPAEIRMEFGQRDPSHSGTAAVDCAVFPGAGETLGARLLRARIVLRRSDVNWRGESVPLSDAELVGAALHEIGHALGFQGHPQRGATVMVRSVERVRAAGSRTLAGRPFGDAALEALYALPSGTRVGRWRLDAGSTEVFDRIHSNAARLGLRGPLVRVGDRAARIAWERRDGKALGILVPRLREVLRDPSQFQIRAEPGAPAQQR